MKRTVILSVSCALSACAANNSSPLVPYPAASIEYQLPITTAKISEDLVLYDCDQAGPVAAAKVAVTPVANPNYSPEQRFQIYGADLSSFSRNKNLGVELYPNGSLKSLNGGVADRTGAIVENILKIGAGLAAFAGPSGTGSITLSGACNRKTNIAVARAKALQQRIDDLRGQLANADPKQSDAIHKAVDGLAAELGRMRTEELHLTLEREIGFRKGFPDSTNIPGLPDWAFKNTGGGVISWKAGELSKWLEVPDASAKADTMFFALGYCVNPTTSSSGDAACQKGASDDFKTKEDRVQSFLKANGRDPYVQVPGCARETPRKCATTLVLRDPVDATLLIATNGPGFKDMKAGKLLASQDLQISQWGDIKELPFTTGLGGNFTVTAGFNEFGRKTAFSWKSDARGEALTSAASSIVTAAGTFRDAFDTDLEKQQAEITELETQQKLNQLRFCREVIEAGGFTCPTN